MADTTQATGAKMSSFFRELKERKVYRVALGYAVVAWLVIQISATVMPAYHAPDWFLPIFITVIALGFPVALVLAWAFELTPEGIKRTEFAEELPKKSARSRAWIYVVIIASAISVTLFFLGRYTSSKQSRNFELPAKSIAVLPFENLS